MTTVLISGWKAGFEKVKFTLLLQQRLGLTLAEAKARTDALLRDEPIELHVPNAQSATLLDELNRLGAQCAAAVIA